jgi:hypothetical protein
MKNQWLQKREIKKENEMLEKYLKDMYDETVLYVDGQAFKYWELKEEKKEKLKAGNIEILGTSWYLKYDDKENKVTFYCNAV